MAESKRKKELLEYIGDNVALVPIIDDMVYLEEELEYLRTLPKIRENPKDKSQQKITPAARLYREAMTQYIGILRVLIRATNTDEDDDTSPLREWLNKRIEQESD